VRRQAPCSSKGKSFRKNETGSASNPIFAAMSTEDILKGLNPPQRAAVEHGGGPALVVAGAGSGKTRVLTHRVAYLLSRGVWPENIMVVTFTNKAANEMKTRIARMVDDLTAQDLWMGTFHSVAARILRKDADKLGYPRSFSIYDTNDAKNAVKRVVTELNLSTDHYKPGPIQSRISLMKSHFISPQQYAADPELRTEDKIRNQPEFYRVYEAYENRLFRAGAMDFDDLLLKWLLLLDQYEDILTRYQRKFEHILVDEYQDTNLLQYLILKKLAAHHRNLFVVGDDAQSIYAFRGANYHNIKLLQKDFPETKIYKLEQNYRSTETIVEAANHLISHNPQLIPKRLWSARGKGEKIKYYPAADEGEEARFVVSTIQQLHQSEGWPYAQFAVLYRANSLSRAFEEALSRERIPYQIIGGFSFYQRQEIRNVLAYWRLLVNPSDEEALMRIINFPTRGIGKTTQNKLYIAARERGVRLWDVVKDPAAFGLRLPKVEAFAAMIEKARLSAAEVPADIVGEAILKESGLLRHYWEDGTEEGKNRIENIHELLDTLRSYVQEAPPDEVRTLADFLQEVALITNADESEGAADGVKLLTVHSAKGLEFRTVFVVGVEEGLFPSSFSWGIQESIEEERRLFYVAVTRAEERLYLTRAHSRFRWGSREQTEPSRFLKEIDRSLIEVIRRQRPQSAQRTPERVFHSKTAARPVPKARPDFVAEPITSLRAGEIIEHDRFGVGKVLHVVGKGPAQKAVIKFDAYGQKTIMIKYAKMRRHG